MNFLSPLASFLGMEVEHITDRIKHAVIINAAMALFGLAAASFLVAAGFMALAEQVGGIYAALICAAAFVVLALTIYLGTRIAEARRKRAIAEKRRSSDTSAFLTTATLTALPVLLRSPMVRTLGLPAAAIAALWVISNGSDRKDD
jgi:cobalamin synthase